MRTRTRAGMALLLLFVTVGYWLLSFSSGFTRSNRSSQRASTPASIAPVDDTSLTAASIAQGQENINSPGDSINSVKTTFSESISVYGRVVDQFGQPIVGAEIRFGIHDKPWEHGSEIFKTSDVDGYFSIDDVKGAAINAEVFKDGYYNGAQSRRIFKPGEHTSKMIPAVLVLYEKGEADAVIHRPSDSINLPHGNNGAYLDFKLGSLSISRKGQLLVEVVSTPGVDHGRYWEYKITITGGGLQKRTHEFAFTAPESGYKEIISGNYASSSPNDETWRNTYSDEFFAMLPDGTKARFKIELGTKRVNYIIISELVYNPNPSSLKLEFDPTKVITPKP